MLCLLLKMSVWKCLYLISMLMVVVGNGRGEVQLVENFYASSCPAVESIVREAVITKMSQTIITGPGTLRLFFHDCFVEGCDASIMISSPNNDAEKDAPDNLSLAGDGFDTITKAKEAVESVCPGVVSCADIIAMAARDVVVLSGGSFFSVELGRRDGLISKASRVAGNLPDPDSDLKVLSSLFSKHNLSQTDLVALSDANSIGVTHCNRIFNRLYKFNSSTQKDPTLDEGYAQELKKRCPQNADPGNFVALDTKTPQVLDELFYRNLQNRKGVFKSDQVLFEDPATRATVDDFASSGTAFNEAFATAMVKLGRVGVKVGDQGEVRMECTQFNA